MQDKKNSDDTKYAMRTTYGNIITSDTIANWKQTMRDEYSAMPQGQRDEFKKNYGEAYKFVPSTNPYSMNYETMCVTTYAHRARQVGHWVGLVPGVIAGGVSGLSVDFALATSGGWGIIAGMSAVRGAAALSFVSMFNSAGKKIPLEDMALVAVATSPFVGSAIVTAGIVGKVASLVASEYAADNIGMPMGMKRCANEVQGEAQEVIRMTPPSLYQHPQMQPR